MIKWLKLQNFQKHKKLLIKFSPTITSIVGPTDSGKSSIVRALRYLTFNTPTGDAFVREGSKGTTVSVATSDGEVTRRRGRGVNHYEVNGKRLEAPGRGMTIDAVTDTLKLDDLNFQYQHDSPLWISESPGQIAKNLNEIVNLDLIDRVLQRLSRKHKGLDAERTICQNRLMQASLEKQELEWSLEADEELKELEKVHASVEDAKSKHTELLAIRNVLVKTISKVEVLKQVASTEELLTRGSQTLETLKRTKDQIKDLKTLKQQINAQQEQIAAASIRKQDTEQRLAEVKSCPICGAWI